MVTTQQEESLALFQKLIDESLEFLSSQGGKYKNFIEDLDKRHRAAIVFKNLNYQVDNGGFLQWIENGYIDEMPYILRYLGEIGTETANKLVTMLEEVNEIHQSSKVMDQYGEEYEEYPYQEMDTAYNEINQTLLQEIETWLATIPAI